MRPSQGTHKTRQRERAVVGGRRGPTEVSRSQNCQKRWRRKAWGGSPEGWISKTALDKLGDGIAVLESGSLSHIRRHMKLSPLEKIGTWRSVSDCLPVGFPSTSRSASCALASEVAGWRRVCRKKSPVAARRSDGDPEGFRRRRK